MRIRTQLRVSAAIAVVVACVVAAALWSVVQSSSEADDERQLARVASREVSTLLVLTQEYPRHFSERAARQWVSGHARLMQALDEAQEHPGAREVLQPLHEAAQRLPDMFARLREIPSLRESPITLRRTELLIDQLTSETQALVDGLDEWSRDAALAHRQAQQRFRRVVMLSVGALALLLFAQAAWVSRRVLRPLRHFDAAVRAVEGGELGVRTGLSSSDELGRLSRSFDAMTQAVAERTRQAQEEVARRERSEQRVRTITDNVPALVAYISPQGTYEFVNAQYTELLGHAADSLIGQPLRNSPLEEDSLARREQQLARALAGEAVDFELIWTVDGTEHCLHTRYLPDIGPDGGVAGVYALSTDITALKAAERQLHELARTDPLTGLPNRRRFMERMDEAIARSHRAARPMALMYLDIDHFKAINDSRGHGGGDRVLEEFAQRLRAAVRITDTVARLAGDEFVIIVEGLNARTEAALVAEKIVAAMRAPIAVQDGEPVQATASIGVAVLGLGRQSAEELLAQADAALYAAKRKGRNGFSVSTY